MLDFAGYPSLKMEKMELTRSSREKKLPQHLQDFQLDLDPTESLQTCLIREELNQVESLLESLTPEAGKQSTSVSTLQSLILKPAEEQESAASITKLQNENWKLELELTRAKIELACRDDTQKSVQGGRPKPSERQHAESRPVYDPTRDCTHTNYVAI